MPLARRQGSERAKGARGIAQALGGQGIQKAGEWIVRSVGHPGLGLFRDGFKVLASKQSEIGSTLGEIVAERIAFSTRGDYPANFRCGDSRAACGSDVVDDGG